MFGLIGSALSSIAGLFGSFFNASMQSVQNSKNIKYQMYENEKNRQYNAAQSAIARNFSANFAREMYDKQFRDNSYSSQISQMKAAGINPALAYSAGNFAGASMPSAASPSASSSGSVSSQVAPQIEPSYMADIALKAAQIENINAQTKKTESETEGQGYTNKILESDAAFRNAFNKGVITLNGVEIELKRSAKNLNDEEVTNLRKHYVLLDADIKKTLIDCDLAKAEIASVGQDVISKRIENSFKEEHMRAIIDNIVANTNLSRAQVKSIYTKLPYEISVLGSQAALNNAMREVQVAMKDNVKADTEVKKGQRNLQAWDSYIKAEQVQTQKAITRSTNASASYTEYDTNYTFDTNDPLRGFTQGVRFTIAALRGSR